MGARHLSPASRLRKDCQARLAVVGFRDIIHIARHQRVEHYSITQELPWQNRPLVKRRHRKVVKGRLVPPHGEELEAVNEEGVLAAARAPAPN